MDCKKIALVNYSSIFLIFKLVENIFTINIFNYFFPICFFCFVYNLTIMFDFEFQIIEFIQKFRTPWLDVFFKFLNFFDTYFFYVLFIPVIWIGYNRKFGIRLFFILFLSFIINEQLKNIFMFPRPSQINPTLGIIHLDTYSFPSGAAQNAILISLIFIHHFRNKIWPIFLGIGYWFFISFSRMYLGVHFLSDLIGGWVVGLLLFLIYLYIFPKIETHIYKKPVFSFWFYQGFFLLLLFVPGLSRFVFAILGVFLGLFLSFEFNMFLQNAKNIKEFFLRSFLALFGLFTISFSYFLLHKKIVFFDLNAVYYIQGFWLSFLCSFVYKKLFLGNKIFK